MTLKLIKAFSSFYDDSDHPTELVLSEEEDGIWTAIGNDLDGFQQGITLVSPQIEELIQILKKQKKRLRVRK